MSFKKIIVTIFLSLLLLLTLLTSNKSNYLKPTKPDQRDKLICSLNSIDRTNKNELSICSFNIKFLGKYKNKDLQTISEILIKTCDLIAIQELTTDSQLELYDLMSQKGFHFIRSKEGTGDSMSYLEWPLIFFDANKIQLVPSSLNDYIEAQHIQNPIFDRVPFAQKFRFSSMNLEFIFLNTHLHYNYSKNDKKRMKNPPKHWQIASQVKRRKEMKAIHNWLRKNKLETFIIAGDFNTASLDEKNFVFSKEFQSTNKECIPTNIHRHTSPKCYDSIILSRNLFSKRESHFDFKVIDLPCLLKKDKKTDLNIFAELYSDHLPVITKLKLL